MTLDRKRQGRWFAVCLMVAAAQLANLGDAAAQAPEKLPRPTGDRPQERTILAAAEAKAMSLEPTANTVGGPASVAADCGTIHVVYGTGLASRTRAITVLNLGSCNITVYRISGGKDGEKGTRKLTFGPILPNGSGVVEAEMLEGDTFQVECAGPKGKCKFEWRVDKS